MASNLVKTLIRSPNRTVSSPLSSLHKLRFISDIVNSEVTVSHTAKWMQGKAPAGDDDDDSEDSEKTESDDDERDMSTYDEMVTSDEIGTSDEMHTCDKIDTYDEMLVTKI
ncbi:hypothetical protein AgCh_007534 [Apium graveolens]